mmetsp:Transcript_14186/g.20616  ORF Transcript_14186/g.20616 Transcript_14186/m.20616 type:complete len:206 (-) Transcript_14186:232-849(-)
MNGSVVPTLTSPRAAKNCTGVTTLFTVFTADVFATFNGAMRSDACVAVSAPMMTVAVWPLSPKTRAIATVAAIITLESTGTSSTRADSSRLDSRKSSGNPVILSNTPLSKLCWILNRTSSSDPASTQYSMSTTVDSFAVDSSSGTSGSVSCLPENHPASICCLVCSEGGASASTLNTWVTLSGYASTKAVASPCTASCSRKNSTL